MIDNYDRWLMSEQAWEDWWGREDDQDDQDEEEYEAADAIPPMMHNGEPVE